MNLLAAKMYDPASAVSKATSALLAMTAFDTTNLRLAITVPAHGMVRFRLQTTLSGATTFPQVLLGVLNGSTILGRQVAMAAIPGTALATTNVPLVADFIATGLTPGAMNVDAAYGVETILASTNIHYGGPNDTTANNAWGGFAFEAWDPQPIPTATPGAANGLVICGSNSAITANITGSLSGSVGSVTGAVGSVTGSVGSVTGLTASNLDVAVSSRMATYTQPTGFLTATFPATVASTTNITGGTITTVTNLTNLPSIPANWLTASGINAGALNGKGDWLLSSGYTAPDNASITTILGRTDVATSTRLASASYTTPPTTSAIASAVLDTPMTESYNAKSAPASLAQVNYTLLAQMGETAIVGTTKTLYKIDGTTVAKTFTLNSATAPTAITRAT